MHAKLQDEKCKNILDVLSRPPSDKDEKEMHNDYCITNNRLYRITPDGKKWVVPKQTRRQVVLHIIMMVLDMSVEKTISAISQLYWFAGMRRYVKKYISSCLECLYNKEPGGRKPGFLYPIEKIAIPFDTLHIDHLGPFVKSKRKNSDFIVVVEAFTKFVFMKAVQSTKVGPLLTFLKSIVETFRVPKRLVTDRGSCYTCQQFKEYCTSLKY